MKKVLLAVALFSLVIFPAIAEDENEDEDWYYLQESSTGDKWYVKFHDVSFEKNVIWVWVKNVLSKPGAKEHPEASHMIGLEVVDCNEKTTFLKQGVVYNAKGEVLDSFKKDSPSASDFNIPTPDSMVHGLMLFSCEAMELIRKKNYSTEGE